MRGIKVELNAKGILMIGILVLGLTFGLGHACNQKEEMTVTFTKADLEAIEKALEVYGDSIEVIKDKDGSLILNLGEVKLTTDKESRQ